MRMRMCVCTHVYVCKKLCMHTTICSVLVSKICKAATAGTLGVTSAPLHRGHHK